MAIKDKEYAKWLGGLKDRIRQSQIKAAVKVNSSLIELYWSLGAEIAAKQKESKWGDAVLAQLSKDLQKEFPDMKGFSKTNLKYIKRFYLFYVENSTKSLFGHQLGDQIEVDQPSKALILHQVGAELEFPQLLGQIPWRHHVEIFSKCETVKEALFYINKTIENGWSRAVLMNFLDTDLYERQGKAVNNFSKHLPKPQSDLAGEIIKDPYNFDFLTVVSVCHQPTCSSSCA